MKRSSWRGGVVRMTRPLLMVCALLVAAATQPTAQAPAETPADVAFREGRFDEVERLLRNATDPRSLALRARAMIRRGQYPQAEALLTKPAAASPTSDAALELGLLQFTLGRRADARRTLNRLLDGLSPPKGPAEFIRFGHAARAIGDEAQSGAERDGSYEDARTAFQEAAALSPNDPDINIALGELFIGAYDPAEAVRYFQIALKQDGNRPAALVGFAKVAIDQNPPDARAALERALKANANYEPAHLLAAQIALDDRRREDAEAAIGRALAINPNSFEARSLDATLAYLEGRTADFERKVKEVLALHPTYGEIYRVVAERAARNYLFDDAVELARRGIAIDPDNTRAHADLGLHLMRTGDEPSARASLERAWERDPLDQTTFNLLDLLDRLDKFEVVQEGNLIVKLEPGEAPVMREHLPFLAREALDALQKRWNFKVPGTVLVEMFPRHDDFAVRTLGLPGMIGALGACFGRVVTIDSPRARRPGEYNWQPTLWHELAHVITLQLSGNRVPRWVSEGISVWEERRARPEWGREMEVDFAEAIEQGKVLKLETINEAFSDPTLISLAYHQASEVMEHLAATYGDASLAVMLRAYGRGLETEEAFKEAFKVGVADVQKSFETVLEKKYGPIRAAMRTPKVEAKKTLDVEALKALASANPSAFVIQMALGKALAEAKDFVGAIAAFERAAKLVPMATGADNPNRMIAAIAQEQNDTARAITALEAVLRVDHADVESARALAPLVETLGDPARTFDVYQRLVNVDPFEASANATLGRLALQRKDLPLAIRSFRTVLATNPPDRATAHTDLGEAYLLSGRFNEARTQLLAALEIAPAFERAQDLWLRLTDGPAR
jgi:tetratricopeptide (TPR) repeat protein